MANQLSTFNNRPWLYALIAMSVALNFSGIFTTIMAPDGALYAGIAKTMVLRADYVNLFAEGRNWLDKPHLPFWLMALSFKCFGFTTWAYKLPALLVLMLGARYTYLLAKNLYNAEVGLWAALILLTSEHIIISNNDVRAEPYLTGFIIAAVYYFYGAINSKAFGPLLFGCLFAACAVMTKGIFALIPVGGAVAGELIIKKKWKKLFNLRWLLAAVLILVFILPELYCLYAQFDMHPEKVVFGHTHNSGIKFFFWDSQFGRFFNNGPIKGHGDPLFFVHTTLWAFLPWSVLLFVAVYQFIKQNRKNVQAAEWYCIGGAALTFLIFSASKFQLPFYTNIIFPFYAIITAQYLCRAKSVKLIGRLQVFITEVLVALIAVLHFFYRPETFGWSVGVLLLLILLLMVFLPLRAAAAPYQKAAILSVLAACFVNLYLNVVFYPSLLKYQAGSEAAFYINKLNRPDVPVVQSMGDYTYPLEFYLDRPLYTADLDGNGKLPAKPFLLYTPTDNLAHLKQTKGWNMAEVTTFDRFWITKVNGQFLNKATRKSTLGHISLVMVH